METAVTTLIAPDNHWALLAILFGATFLAIWLEQKYKWASKISGAVITLAIAILLVNVHVIPAASHVYDDIVWGYAVPMAIPLLLLQTNIRKIRKETGRFLLIFLIATGKTVLPRRMFLLSPGMLFLLKPAVGRLPKGIRIIISGGWTNLISVIYYAAVLIAVLI